MNGQRAVAATARQRTFVSSPHAKAATQHGFSKRSRPPRRLAHRHVYRDVHDVQRSHKSAASECPPFTKNQFACALAILSAGVDVLRHRISSSLPHGLVRTSAFGDYGLPFHSLFGMRFWQGIGFGIAEIAVLIGCIAAFHGYTFGPIDLHGLSIWKWAIFWLLFFIVVGLFEEFAFRGYLQFTLADGVGFWPAAWILSIGFGAVHLANPGEGVIGALSVAMIGVIFAFTLKRTGNLWFVVGWHAAFDFGETYLFSVPNSGNVFQGHLSNASLHGPTWLTGGTVGPEGSIFSFITMAAAALFIHKAFPARNPASEASGKAANSAPAT